ncbi:hypothetical protein [Massilia aerilata]|uniref:DUF2325 domain-containing protein n=1 Tax=Massilia aerilata TaxID=453817 RepID=A0ABW0S2V3_9BURK
MVTKRQFSHIEKSAMRHLNFMSPQAFQVSRDTWRKVCFDTLQAELAMESQGHEIGRPGARAIAAIQRRCEPLVKGQKVLEMGIRTTAGWDAYTADLREVYAQEKLLYTQLPQFVWEQANECVSASIPAAVAWIQAGGYELLRPAVDHMTAIAMASKFKNPAARYKSAAAHRHTDAFWRPLIRTGGGAKYFLCYAVAVAMADQFMGVAYAVQGRANKLDPFATPPFLDLLTTPRTLWTDRYQPMVTALAFMPADQRGHFVAAIAAQRQAMQRTFEDAQRMSSGLERQTGLLEKQASTLRKHLTRAEDRATQLQHNNLALMETLRTATSKAAVRLAPAEHAREINGYDLALREKETQLGRLQTSLSETTEQLALTRELLTVLLEPAPGVGAKPVHAGQETDPQQWRIVFVGGHERLHTKLRKQMRRAIFLHPDQSRFSSEAFDGVDAVVFSIGYCSHALAYRAADEVRRRGLRAGYSNCTNVELVLDEVRAILYQGQ